jgi:hypothetical protein
VAVGHPEVAESERPQARQSEQAKALGVFSEHNGRTHVAFPLHFAAKQPLVMSSGAAFGEANGELILNNT